MTKFTVTDTALKAGEPWGHAPIHVELVDSTGAAVSPAYVDATGVLVEAFDTVADGDGVFTLTLDSTADISPTGCFYLVRIGDADNIISGDDGDGTVRGLRASTPTVLGSTATFDGLADVNMAGKADGDVPTWDTTTGRYIPGTGGGVKLVEVMASDMSTNITTGDGKAGFMVPASMNGMNLIRAHAALLVAQSTSGTPTVQVRRVRSGTPVDMLSTRITIDANESTSHTAATPPVVDTDNDDVTTGDLLFIDVDVAGTDATGLLVTLEFQLP